MVDHKRIKRLGSNPGLRPPRGVLPGIQFYTEAALSVSKKGMLMTGLCAQSW